MRFEYILIFPASHSKCDVQALRRGIVLKLRESGLVVKEQASLNKKSYFGLVSADFQFFQHAAEACQLRKMLRSGLEVPFTAARRDEFEKFVPMSSFFSSRERCDMINATLSSLTVDERDTFRSLFTTSYPLLNQCVSRGFMEKVPLHDHRELDDIRGVQWSGRKLLRKVRNYYGEQIGMYFAWLSCYTYWLTGPALLGPILFFAEWKLDNTQLADTFVLYTRPLWSFFIWIWSLRFLKAWMLQESELAYEWNMLSVDTEVASATVVPREEFQGEMKRSPITGIVEKHFPARMRFMRYLVTVPCMLLMFLIVFATMLLAFSIEDNLSHDEYGLLQHVPTLIYCAIIPVYNVIFSAVAEGLNNYENHKFEEEHNNHLLAKLMLFQLTNNFLAMLWVALVMKDFARLRSLLFMTTLTQQYIFSFLEVFFPWVSKWRIRRDEEKYAVKKTPTKRSGLSHAVVARLDMEARLPSLAPGAYYDYLEMMLQFGHIVMFSVALPIAPLFALINNIFEIRTDAYKLSEMMRRPVAQRANSIALWKYLLIMLILMAVITNAAILTWTQTTYEGCFSSTDGKWAFVIACEHVLILSAIVYLFVLPSQPVWLRTQLKKEAFERNAQLRKHDMSAVRDAENVANIDVVIAPDQTHDGPLMGGIRGVLRHRSPSRGETDTSGTTKSVTLLNPTSNRLMTPGEGSVSVADADSFDDYSDDFETHECV